MKMWRGNQKEGGDEEEEEWWNKKMMHVRTTTGALCDRAFGIDKLPNPLVDWFLVAPLTNFFELPTWSFIFLFLFLKLFFASCSTLIGDDDASLSISRLRSLPIIQFSFQTLKKSFGSWPLLNDIRWNMMGWNEKNSGRERGGGI